MDLGTTEGDGLVKMKGIEKTSAMATQANQTRTGILFHRLTEMFRPVDFSASESVNSYGR